MSSTFRAVRPMTSLDIESAATQLRKILRLPQDGRVQMVQLIETVLDELLPDYLFQVIPDSDMPGMDGLSEVGSFGICLADHTYRDLCNGDAEARVVAAHELGHLILHSHQQPALAHRSFHDNRVDPEWQADRFADFWLMPTIGVQKCKSAHEVAERFSVPLTDADRRYMEVIKIQGELF